MVGKQISVKDLKEVLDKNNAKEIVIDVRSPYEFEKGAISGSRNISLNRILNELDLLASYEKVYLVCLSGGRSQMALVQLECLGLHNLYNVSGGINAWVKNGYSLIL